MIDYDTIDNGQGLPSSLPHTANGGGFIVCSWGLVRYLPTLENTRRFLEQIGGSHGV